MQRKVDARQLQLETELTEPVQSVDASHPSASNGTSGTSMQIAFRPAMTGRPPYPRNHAEEFLELVDHCTYRDDRVRPCHA